MSWECMKCGTLNTVKDDFNCKVCFISKEISDSMISSKKMRFCEECGHMHRFGKYCQVYCPNEEDDDDEIEGAINVDDDDDDSDSDDSVGSLGLGPRKSNFSQSTSEMKQLPTPDFVKEVRYIRCNCKVGVPHNSRRFEPIPALYRVGGIFIQFYDEIMDRKRQTKGKLLSKEEEDAQIKKEKEVRQKKLSELLPSVMAMLPLGMCSVFPKICRDWNVGANSYKAYVDIRDMVPWKIYRPHTGRIDSLALYHSLVFSGADRRVLASDYKQGITLATITRDSGEIPFLLEHDGSIFTCSSNGSMRLFNITHNLSKMQVNTTMWDHYRDVNKVLMELPTYGVCLPHGIENHICCFYTCSLDRTIRVWDSTKYAAIRTVSSNSLRRITFTTLAQSERHLFAGTTGSTVAVFSKHDICEREDIHSCNSPGADKAFCLQVTLALPPSVMKNGNLAVVSCLLCTGYNYCHSHLWAGDSTGQITIWSIPTIGLEFQPEKTWKCHQGSVNAMMNTWTNVFTIGDDGFLFVYNIISFAKIRSINLLDWCIQKSLFHNNPIRSDVFRRLKSMDIKEDSQTGGTCIVGTSYGDIIVMNIGTDI